MHLGVCAYNSLFIGPLLLPDWVRAASSWLDSAHEAQAEHHSRSTEDLHKCCCGLLPPQDMFHSQHPAASLHAAARAASGGPVYVSDAPSCHDSESPDFVTTLLAQYGHLLQRCADKLHGVPPEHCLETGDGNVQSASGLCPVWGAVQRSLVPGAAGALLKRLVLPDGSVLRAARPALPTRDTLFCDVLRDRRTLLKVGMQIQAQCSTSCCASQTPALHLCCMFVQHTELVQLFHSRRLYCPAPWLTRCCWCAAGVEHEPGQRPAVRGQRAGRLLGPQAQVLRHTRARTADAAGKPSRVTHWWHTDLLLPMTSSCLQSRSLPSISIDPRLVC